MGGFADATSYDIAIDSGEVRGKMYHIACLSWTTSDGRMTPVTFKFEDDNGDIQTVRDIRIRSSEEKHYSGIASWEYACEAIIGGLVREFQIICYLEATKWVMVI